MQSIAVCGVGYVGLVTAACLASLGHDVTAYDSDASKIARLCDGALPFYEPELSKLVRDAAGSGRLRFTCAPETAYASAGVIFIAVGTPVGPLGEADLTYVRAAVRDIARHARGDVVVVNKSTVPVETADLVERLLEGHAADAIFRVASNPEFLREGSAVADFLQPDRIVIGTNDAVAAERLRSVYRRLDAPVMIVDAHTAEMIKYAANAFLATKVSFVNELANLCDAVGADVEDVLTGMGYDGRIGTKYMRPGLGFGGSCLPKDVSALRHVARTHAIEPTMLDAVLHVNQRQIAVVLQSIQKRVGELDGTAIAIAGLAFKPDTDDVRESPAIALARALAAQGALVRVHDPVAIDAARAHLGEAVTYCGDVYEAARGSACLVCATPWQIYRELDWRRLRSCLSGSWFIDARNAFDPGPIAAAGLRYAGIGRGPSRETAVA